MKTTLHKIYITNNSSITLVNGSDIVLADDFTVETGTGTSGRIDMVTEDDEEVTAVEDQPELPSWDEAPVWAQWRAVNAHGMLIYFENEPRSRDGSGADLIISTPGRPYYTVTPLFYLKPKDWQATIEQRPFEPPWDKIASPYDVYRLTEFGRYPYFCAYDRNQQTKDLWTPESEYSRIERGRIYRRPDSE